MYLRLCVVQPRACAWPPPAPPHCWCHYPLQGCPRPCRYRSQTSQTLQDKRDASYSDNVGPVTCRINLKMHTPDWRTTFFLASAPRPDAPPTAPPLPLPLPLPPVAAAFPMVQLRKLQCMISLRQVGDFMVRPFETSAPTFASGRWLLGCQIRLLVRRALPPLAVLVVLTVARALC